MIALLVAISLSCEPPTVGVSQLWEVFDYEYTQPDGEYAEATIAAYAVELRHALPCGVTGWRYIGYIQSTELYRYADSHELSVAWWCDVEGRSGRAMDVDNALYEMMQTRNVNEYAEVWRN